jgi:hypothetical protein
MIVWKSELTSELVDERLSTDELAELAHELDNAIMQICQSYGIGE